MAAVVAAAAWQPGSQITENRLQLNLFFNRITLVI